MGVGLVLGAWLARYLGPEQFGLLNLAASFVGVFGAIAAMGISGIVVRDLVREPDVANLTLGTAALLHVIGSALGFLMMLTAISYVREDDALFHGIVAILGSVIFLKFGDIAVYWFECHVQSHSTVWVQNGVFLAFAIVKSILILKQAPLIAFAWAMLGEAVLVAVILLIVFNRKGLALSRLNANLARAKRLLTDSLPIMFSAVAITLYTRIDQIMLGQMVGNEAVGIYSAATRLSEVWYLVPSIFVATLFPALASSHKINPTEFHSRLQRLYGFLVKLAFLIAVITSIAAEHIILLIFGENYLASADVLKWHIWGGIFVFFGTAWSRWIILEGLQKVAAVIHFLSLLANIMLNLLLIPIYGAVGAAIATTVSFSLGHTIFAAFFPSQRKALYMFLTAFK